MLNREMIGPIQNPEIYATADGHHVESYDYGSVKVLHGFHPITTIRLGEHHDLLEVYRYSGAEFNKIDESHSVYLKKPGSKEKTLVIALGDKPDGKGFEYNVYSSEALGEEKAKIIGSASGKRVDLAIAAIFHPDLALLEDSNDAKLDKSVIEYIRQVVVKADKVLNFSDNSY